MARYDDRADLEVRPENLFGGDEAVPARDEDRHDFDDSPPEGEMNWSRWSRDERFWPKHADH